MEEIANFSNVGGTGVDLIADGQASYLLTFSNLLETCLGFVHREVLTFNYAFQLSAEISIFFVHVVHGTEGDVISISRIMKVEATGKSAQSAIKCIADCVSYEGRCRCPLRKNIFDGTIIVFLLDAA